MSNFDDLFEARFADGGRGEGKYDCWGLAMEVHHRLGVELPDFDISCFDSGRIHSQVEAEKGRWQKLEKPEAPCVVLMRYDPARPRFATHIGTYIGGGRFVHILLKTGVITNSINEMGWKPQIEGFWKWNPTS